MVSGSQGFQHSFLFANQSALSGQTTDKLKIFREDIDSYTQNIAKFVDSKKRGVSRLSSSEKKFYDLLERLLDTVKERAMNLDKEFAELVRKNEE
jgi:hypothetical protein